jgi:hypothetical protein
VAIRVCRVCVLLLLSGELRVTDAGTSPEGVIDVVVSPGVVVVIVVECVTGGAVSVIGGIVTVTFPPSQPAKNNTLVPNTTNITRMINIDNLDIVYSFSPFTNFNTPSIFLLY